MRTSVVIGALVATLALGVGTYLVLTPADEDASEERGPRRAKARSRAQPHHEAPPRDADLETRVAYLEHEVAELRAELRRLKMRPAGPGFAGGGPAFDDIDEDDLVDGPVADGVRQIVADERRAEEERRLERRAERMAEIAGEQLDQLVAAADLNTGQRENIEALWSSERQQAMEMFMDARSGERDFRGVRADLEKVREATDAEVAGMLTDEQYATYLDYRPMGRGGGRGPGMGPGRPGGGPPPGGG